MSIWTSDNRLARDIEKMTRNCEVLLETVEELLEVLDPPLPGRIEDSWQRWSDTASTARADLKAIMGGDDADTSS